MSTFLKRLLGDILEESEVSKLTSSFDVIGSIVILKIPETLVDRRQVIGERHYGQYQISQIGLYANFSGNRRSQNEETGVNCR